MLYRLYTKDQENAAFRTVMANKNFLRRSAKGPDEASAKAPHFFKILLSSEPRLRVPAKFVQKYIRSLPRIVSIELPAGPVWQVEMTCSDGEAWLEKGFQKFKEYYTIEVGYLLVFRYGGDFYFHVYIFDSSATEIDYPSSGSKEKHQETVFNKSCTLNKASLINKEVSIGILDDFPSNDDCFRKSQEPEDDVSVEILDDFPERKAEGKKADFPSHHSERIQNQRRVKLEMACSNVVPSCLKQNIKKECNQQSPIPRSLPTVREKEKFKAYQRAKAFKSGKPFFFCFMQPSYVSVRFVLNIPWRFAKEFLKSQGYSDVVLFVPDGRMWTVSLHIRLATAKLSWRNFVEDNSMRVGDVCVFERGNDTRPSLKVLIFRS